MILSKLSRGAIHAVAVLAALIAPAAPSTAAPSKPVPFRWNDVGFTADCNPNPAFTRLLGIFSGPKPKDDVEPVFDESLYNAVAGDIAQELFLDTPQEWHGLKLTGVKFYGGIERGPVNYFLYFAEAPERVRTVWNSLGWKLPAKEETREVIEDYAFIGVQSRDNGGSLVGCWRD